VVTHDVRDFHLEGAFQDGRSCLAPKSSPSAALSLASGFNSLLTDCEPAVAHAITEAITLRKKGFICSLLKKVQ